MTSIIDRFLDAGEEPTQTLLPIEGYEKKPLVSLEDAGKPIQELVHNLERMVWMAKRNSSSPSDGLTIDESAAIHLYTMEWEEPNESVYTQLNRTLRSERRKSLKPWFSYLKLFLTALYKLPSIKKTIWRGIHGNVSDQYNKDYIWWGFSSCTETLEILEEFIGRSGVRTIFMIECFNGKPIRDHSFCKTENEILLMPGTYLHVRSKWSPAEGLHMIHLEERTAPYQLLAPPFDIPTSVADTLPLDKLSISKKNQPGGRTPSGQSHRETKAQNDQKNSSSDIQEQTKYAAMSYFPSPHDHVLPEAIQLPAPPDSSPNTETLYRVIGSLVGLAVGDALGASVESRPHQYLLHNPVYDMQSGGTWGLKAGEWTDDTSMALCLASSLIDKRGFDPYNQMVRYKWWYKYGFLSSKGHCFDIDSDTRQSLDEFGRRQNLLKTYYHCRNEKELDELAYDSVQRVSGFSLNCGSPGAAGNGALMRIAPVALFYFRSPHAAIENAGRSAVLTHGDDKAVDACRYYAALIVAAINGEPKKELLSEHFYTKHYDWFGSKELHPEVLFVVGGSYKRLRGYDDGIRGKQYVVNALEAALWAFWSDENSFEKGARAAVNLGDDTDTTAAIYGQLAGAHYGYQNIPENWRRRLYAHDLLVRIAQWLHSLEQRDYPSHPDPRGAIAQIQSTPKNLSAQQKAPEGLGTFFKDKVQKTAAPFGYKSYG